MDNLIINSCLAILNFKRSNFEERIKTANILDKISSKVKEFFDRYSSDELVVILRYKQSDDDGGMVELRPFVKGKGKKLVPASEEYKSTLDTVYMTQEEYNDYLEREGITPKEEKYDRVDYSTIPDENKNKDFSKEELRIIDKLHDPETIIVTSKDTEKIYTLTDIVKVNDNTLYELSDLYTNEKQLISREKMKSNYVVLSKHIPALKDLINKKQLESKKEEEKGSLEEEEGTLKLDTERYEEIRNLLNKQLEKEKSKGKERTPQEIERAVNKLLEKEGISQSKFWAWLEEEEAFLESEKGNEFERDATDVEKYRDVSKYVKDKIDKAKVSGKPITQAGINRFISKVLEQRGIKEYKFWEWQDEVRERIQSKKLKNIASILGTTLIKTADFLTELNPDEEKPAFDEETNKEVIVDKSTTAEGRPVVTIGDKDDTEKKTYDQNSPELKNITDDLSQIIAFTSEQRVILAELGYAI